MHSQENLQPSPSSQNTVSVLRERGLPLPSSAAPAAHPEEVAATVKRIHRRQAYCRKDVMGRAPQRGGPCPRGLARGATQARNGCRLRLVPQNSSLDEFLATIHTSIPTLQPMRAIVQIMGET